MITVTNLRKIFTEQGVKGASKWKREDFNSAIIAAEFAAHEEASSLAAIAELQAVASAPIEVTTVGGDAPKAKKGMCNVCGKRRAAKFTNGQCALCDEEGGWENQHSDSNHKEKLALGYERTAEESAEIKECWVCHPELNRAQMVKAPRAGVARAGQVVIAKGRKADVFKGLAEAAGFKVEIDETSAGYTTATAVKGGTVLVAVWFGAAWLYGAGTVTEAGKTRKVRNLKEASRILAANA